MNAIATLRHTVGSARVARARAITEARTSNPSVVPIVYKASYSNDVNRMPQATWTVWNENWAVAITHNATMDYSSLKDTFRNRGQAYFIPCYDRITVPPGNGR